ncbi:VPLPA-CTERM-specific exosortase XrtD [Jannaschia sp. W003]|uniref:VPLPA-CTERM-specific exosortase XrtD n=1 Tax=Jannaschia sp. W003 TaxID=2867012 RepID=UPI0021A5B00D|nr:VPLPA-CTERM-specific exosortase XrtD [Jannaschia sp. W003]UWQ21844.1 VPLPA-CTERM-specific exosortase XrtD [Jannaschia sp. W003]
MTAAALRRAAPAPALLVLLALAAGAAFAPGLAALGAAWSTPEYSHGPLIPLISAWLLLRGMQAEGAPPVGGARWPGALVLGLALALAAVGARSGIGDVSAYGLIAWAMAMLLLWRGWRGGATHWAAVGHLVFMLPLPQLLWWKANLVLQGLSAELGVAAIALAGVPVWLEGHVIDLGVWQLEVAEACSGLRYMFPILSFAVIVAVCFRGPGWGKALLVLAAAPVAVLLNAGRIALIGVAVDRWGIAAAEGALHLLQGWAVFAACLALLLALAAGLRCFAPRPGPLLDLGGADAGAALRALGRAGAPRAAVAGAAATALAALAIALAPPPDAGAVARAPFAAFPATLGPWRGRATALPPALEAALGATDYLDLALVAPGERAPVNLFAAWYRSQVGGEGLHSPEICLPAGGWEVAALAHARVAPPGLGAWQANRAVITRGAERRLVLFWFEGRGGRTVSDWRARLAVLRDGALRGRTDGGLVRVMTPVAAGETEADAEARLLRVLARAVPRLGEHVPG